MPEKDARRSGVMINRAPVLTLWAAVVAERGWGQAIVVNSRRRDLRPHRTLEFSYGAFTPQETKGRYTPPWNPNTRFPPASWGVYSAKIKYFLFPLFGEGVGRDVVANVALTFPVA